MSDDEPFDLKRILRDLGEATSNSDEDESHDEKAARKKQKEINKKEGIDVIAARYLKKNKFKVGDKIKWKKGAQDKMFPSPGTHGVVVEVFDPPLHGDNSTRGGDAYWREPLDLRVGVLTPDGSFCIFHFDSHRFEPA